MCEELRCNISRLLRLSEAIDHVLNGNDTPLNACGLDDDFMELQHDLFLWRNTGEDLLSKARQLEDLMMQSPVTPPATYNQDTLIGLI